MHSRLSLFRKVHSSTERTKFANMKVYKIEVASYQPHIAKPATIIANVLASFKSTKKRNAMLILQLVDCSVEFPALAIVVSGKIRLRWLLRNRQKVEVEEQYHSKWKISSKSFCEVAYAVWHETNTSKLIASEMNIPDNKKATGCYPDS